MGWNRQEGEVRVEHRIKSAHEPINLMLLWGQGRKLKSGLWKSPGKSWIKINYRIKMRKDDQGQEEEQPTAWEGKTEIGPVEVAYGIMGIPNRTIDKQRAVKCDSNIKAATAMRMSDELGHGGGDLKTVINSEKR
nr:hypothetical protein Iba_chr11aCG5180 [Ipomoea batatas]